VQREDAVGEPLVLERLAQDAGALDREAIVGEGERAGVGELGHLGELGPLLPAGDRRREADRDAGLVARALAQ
jgi:hypothetical protein